MADQTNPILWQLLGQSNNVLQMAGPRNIGQSSVTVPDTEFQGAQIEQQKQRNAIDLYKSQLENSTQQQQLSATTQQNQFKNNLDLRKENREDLKAQWDAIKDQVTIQGGSIDNQKKALDFHKEQYIQNAAQTGGMPAALEAIAHSDPKLYQDITEKESVIKKNYVDLYKSTGEINEQELKRFNDSMNQIVPAMANLSLIKDPVQREQAYQKIKPVAQTMAPKLPLPDHYDPAFSQALMITHYNIMDAASKGSINPLALNAMGPGVTQGTGQGSGNKTPGPVNDKGEYSTDIMNPYAPRKRVEGTFSAKEQNQVSEAVNGVKLINETAQLIADNGDKIPYGTKYANWTIDKGDDIARQLKDNFGKIADIESRVYGTDKGEARAQLENLMISPSTMLKILQGTGGRFNTLLQVAGHPSSVDEYHIPSGIPGVTSDQIIEVANSPEFGGNYTAAAQAVRKAAQERDQLKKGFGIPQATPEGM